MNPLLQALHDLGGSASISELEDAVGEKLGLSDDEMNVIHKGNKTVFSYRLAWARSYLKYYGVIENSSRGVWALTLEGRSKKSVNPEEVKRIARELSKQKQQAEKTDEIIEDEPKDELTWQDELIETIKGISAKSFENLCKRLLRESGFINVEVTGKSGDGGIDGKGVVKVGGLLSFHVVFQAKRYKDTVPTGVVRDFRGPW